jgi:hypothetical protein
VQQRGSGSKEVIDQDAAPALVGITPREFGEFRELDRVLGMHTSRLAGDERGCVAEDGWVYPAEQSRNGSVLPGLPEVLSAFQGIAPPTRRACSALTPAGSE